MLKELIEKGYFPGELPPPFCSTSAGVLASHLDNGFWEGKVPLGKPVIYNLARSGGVRRRLSIPNPIHHVRLSKLIADNWSAVFEPVYARSQISLSTPQLGNFRALLPKKTFQDLYLAKAAMRASGRFLLKADISRCYPSIYTHAVEWAVSGKAAAKTRVTSGRSTTIGARLDDFIRHGQDNQTMGIPIGPDTSLAISELVLCAADVLLQERGIGEYCFRYVDDYELVFTTPSEAQEALAKLQSVLSEFELDLNPKKTSITPLPEVFDEPWATNLKGSLFRPSSKGQRRDIIRFFDQSIALARAYPNEHVLKYAIGILKNIELSEEDWALGQYWLLQCLSLEPGTLPSILSEFIYYRDLQYQTDTKRFAEQMQLLIIENAPMAHSSEVVWAIWAMICLNEAISENAVKVISDMDDAVIALMALYARETKIINRITTTLWQQHINGDALWGANWLLAYEASERGWLTSTSGGAFVRANPFFVILDRLDVRFFDETRTTKPAKKPNEVIALGSDLINLYP